MTTGRTIAAQPAHPSARISAIDGLRGAFLVLMTITHVTVPGGSILKSLHPDTIAFVDSAAGFVFLSGLMAGLVYGRSAIRHGFAVVAARMRSRALQLYGWSVGLVLLICLAAVLAPGAAAAWRDWAGPLTTPDARSVGAALLLLQEADFADVLPMYALFLLLGQGALWLCLKGRYAAALATSALVWAMAQAGAGIPVVAWLSHGLVQVRPDLGLPDTFNLMAWQFLFIVGLCIGCASATGRLRMDRAFRPQDTYLVWLCLAAAAMIAVATVGLRLNHPGPHTPGSPTWLIQMNTSKTRLGIGCLINFVVFAYPLTWMLAVGRQSHDRILAPLAQAAGAVVALPFLRLIGRHSLHVYVWQVALVYGLKLLDERLGGSSPPLNAALILGCIALLAVPAVARERLVPRRRVAALGTT